MSHELSFINGLPEFAYLAGTPVWHGFGQPVPIDQRDNLDYWKQASNMGNWAISQAPALAWDVATESAIAFPQRKLLYRSDTKAPLADVGANFNVVQPVQVIDFFDSLIRSMGFKMLSCGVLFGGRKFWAQADIGQSINLLGQERIEGKLLLGTSCDLSMKTRAQYTNTAVVCNNTLTAAIGSNKNYVELSHAGQFDADAIKEALGLNPVAFAEWGRLASKMGQQHMDVRLAEAFFDRVFNGPMPMVIPADAVATPEQLEALAAVEAERKSTAAIATCLELFEGALIGKELECRQGTVWGAVNCITQFIDHERKTKTMDARIDRAWFGDGDKIKSEAWNEAIQLAA